MALKKPILEECLSGSVGIVAASAVTEKCRELCIARAEVPSEGNCVIKTQLRLGHALKRTVNLTKLIYQLTTNLIFRTTVLVSQVNSLL